MKRLDTVPEAVLNTIMTAHQRALIQVCKNYMTYCTLPVRPARMRIKRGNNADQLEQTIVPATTISLAPNSFLDEDHINRDGLIYTVTGTPKPFPLAHVFNASGHVCLGNIFVPSKVSKYSPQQPLETLFLHNDRNLRHGNASMILGPDEVEEIKTILLTDKVELSPTAKAGFKSDTNLLQNDEIWQIGADIYQQKEVLEAIQIMKKIYDCIFRKDVNKNDEEIYITH